MEYVAAVAVIWLIFLPISAALSDPHRDRVEDIILLIPYWRLARRLGDRLAELLGSRS